MKKIFLILTALCSSALFAQTISPVVSEYSKKASGEFTVTNNSLQPMSVVIEAKSFHTEGSKMVLGDLEAQVHLKLEEHSTKLGPKQAHTFYYDTKCDSGRCAVLLLARMTPVQRAGEDTVKMSINLGHDVYICSKSKGCRQSFLTEWAYVPPVMETK